MRITLYRRTSVLYTKVDRALLPGRAANLLQQISFRPPGPWTDAPNLLYNHANNIPELLLAAPVPGHLPRTHSEITPKILPRAFVEQLLDAEDHTRPRRGRCWPHLAQFWPNLMQIWKHLENSWPNLECGGRVLLNTSSQVYFSSDFGVHSGRLSKNPCAGVISSDAR